MRLEVMPRSDLGIAQCVTRLQLVMKNTQFQCGLSRVLNSLTGALTETNSVDLHSIFLEAYEV